MIVKRKIVAGIIIGVVALSLLAAALFGGAGAGYRGAGSTGDAVGVVRIDGVIAGGSGGLFGAGAGSESVMEQLRQAARDPSIKAVVLRLNTPGGTAAASQEIALEVSRLRRGGKHVVASMGDMAASGGYWIASQCDRIVASPGTITGSIGVIMETTDLQGLYDKLGVDSRVFKSGAHKDMGSSTRDITPEEQKIFQDMVDEMYEQFVATVSSGRGLDPARVRRLADGRVFTGRQALEHGLVDELGNYYDAIKIAAGMAGIRGEPEVVELNPGRGWWEALGQVKLGFSELRSPAWLIYRPAEG